MSDVVTAAVASAPGAPSRSPQGLPTPLLLTAAAVSAATLLALPWGGGPLVIVFSLLVPGTAVLAWLPRSPVSALVLVPFLSFSLLTLLAGLCAALSLWHPTETTAAVAVVALLALVGALARERAALASTIMRTPAAGARAPRGARTPARLLLPFGPGVTVLLLLAVGLWGLSLVQIDPSTSHPYGLLISDAWAFGLSGLVALIAFVAAARRDQRGAMVAAIVVFTVIARATGALALDAPVADWAYKHLGVVAHLRDLGGLDPGLDIYQAWHGFFAAVAWVSAASGVSAFTLAMWTPPAVGLALAAAVHALARRLGVGSTGALAAALIAVAANWSGQDYFAPQSVAVPLAVAVLALLLPGASPHHRTRARTTISSALVALVLFSALVISHQLTPFWVIGSAIALTVIGRLQWYWSVALIAIAAAQVLLHLDYAESYGIFSGTDVIANATSTAGAASGSRELDVHALTNRVACLTLWGSAALLSARLLARDGWGRWRRTPMAAATVIAFSPFGILLGQSYGGEAIVRVFLYSIPGCAVILGWGLARGLRGSLAPRLVAAATVIVVAASAGHAYFSTWYHYAVTPAEYEASVALSDDVPGFAYLAPLSPYWPTLAGAGYAERMRADPLFDAPLHAQGSGLASPDYLDGLEESLAVRNHPTYVLIGPRMDAYAAYRGIAPAGTVESIRAALRDRAGWDVVIDEPDDGVSVLRFVPPGAEDQEASTWTP